MKKKDSRKKKTTKPHDNKKVGVVNGISKEHDLNELKRSFTTEENKINKIERLTTKLGKLTNTIKITFASAIAPLRKGSEIIGFFNVEPLLTNSFDAIGAKDSVIPQKCRAEKPRCPHCAKNHTHKECRRKKATICANCGSHEHRAAFRGCPVAVKYYNEIQIKKILLKKRAQRKNLGSPAKS